MSKIHVSRYTHSSLLYFVIGSCLMQIGCFGGSDAGHQRELVQGIIYCGRTPLKEGVVRFEPADNESSLDAASGSIQSNGEFRLATDQGAEIQPGRYRVIVTDASGNTDGEVRSRSGQLCLYGDTGQVVQVVAGGNNQFRFAMAGPDGPRDMPEGE